MLVPDHGRHSFPFSFGTAAAAPNESIPFRDAFYISERLPKLQCPGRCSRKS